MTARFPFRKSIAGLAALTLALGLAACGDKTEEGATSGEKIEVIAPPAGKAWTDMVAKTEEGGYRMGNPDAPIKLVEYGALSCSHCAEFAKEAFEPLRDDYVASGRVSYELRLYMLNVLDIPAALLATCGTDEAVLPLSEQFWGWQGQMFDTIQGNQGQLQAAGELPPAQRFQAIAQAAGMTDFFASRGIAKDQAAACLADVDKATAFANQTDTALQEKNVTGTPTFFINGSNVGTASWDMLEPELQKAGAR
ncbi:protein-disulfide isomerase [Novosphingobium sp. PC22D]|uniref:thioredoxin domain-containing protein n=1 Tax=Novosphingobium sp. PC22D TaxID=1962403 RepID=UPI000BFAD1AB|nr:thioredoxin domain-containing protein [Novosphingobium sp. PC22D]PEQ12938.1 protein-disulfide isomerase [Novosphingobium sp. PC22D]